LLAEQPERGEEEKELTGAEGGATELVRLSSGRGKRVADADAGHGGARGGPFIGARGEGSSGVWWTPVRCTAIGVYGAQWRRWDRSAGRCHARTRPQQARTKRCRTSLCDECSREEKRTVAGGDHVGAVRGEGDRVVDWRGQLVSDARARESEGECGWQVGSGSNERERARGAGW
jgi:hypothetical protein